MKLALKVTAWAFGVLALIVIIWGINFGGRYLGVWGERIIFEQSYQKQNADSEMIRQYRSNLAKIEAQLENEDLPSTKRAELEGQKRSLEILIETE